MSAAIEALVSAWRLGTVPTRELAIRLLNAAHAINEWLAVPPSDPGIDRGQPLQLDAESSADVVRIELQRYDAQSTRFQGLPLDVLFALRPSTGVIPGWPAVARLARDRGGPSIDARVQELQAAYEDLTRDRVSLGGTIEDSPARVWLYGRLQSVRLAPAPESGGGFKWLLLALGAYYLLGDSK